jgi:hypothetical protein
MKVLKNNLVTILFVLASALFLVPAVVKPVITGEPPNHTFLVLALAASVFAFIAGRKSTAGSGPPSV